MPNITENYGLKKPLPEEFYDVNVQNENMDKIDAELKKKYDHDNKPTPADIGAYSKEETDTLLQNKAPLSLVDQVNLRRTYQCVGLILDGDGCDMQGVGAVSIAIHTNGLAEINFSVCITQNTYVGVFRWGINPSLFKAIDPNVPTITPIPYLGIVTAFNADGSYNAGICRYGCFPEVESNRWRIARIYDVSGKFGGWSCDAIPAGTRLVGTCYGIVD